LYLAKLLLQQNRFFRAQIGYPIYGDFIHSSYKLISFIVFLVSYIAIMFPYMDRTN